MVDSSTVLRLALDLTAAALFVASAYWAMEIRRALATPLYRRQALSVAMVGSYFAVLWLVSPFTNPLVGSVALTNGGVGVASAGSFFVGIIIIFAWIDESVRVARRADPLLRDSLNWSKVRIAIWALIALDVVTFLVGYSFETSGIPPGNKENFGFLASFLIILVMGTPALFVSARRSRDASLRRNLGWFGLFVATVITYAEIGYFTFAYGLINTSTLQGTAPGVIVVLILITFLPTIGGYGLYRSARSLSPVSRLPAPSEREKY